jgi:hypothetical protein
MGGGCGHGMDDVSQFSDYVLNSFFSFVTPAFAGMTDYCMELYGYINYWHQLKGEGCVKLIVPKSGRVKMLVLSDFFLL